MLYSRSFLLLAGLPAVLSFGVAPRPGEGYEVTVASESASAQVNNDALQLPSDMCSKLLDVEIITNENEWCNTGQPEKSKCDGNRLRRGASTITTLGASTIFDVCQWDDDKNKCALARVSYICRNDCAGVAATIAQDGTPPLSDWATDVYIQTDCSLKTEQSAASWYEDPPGSGEYSSRYITDVQDTSCKQKLVRCLPGEVFIPHPTCNTNVDMCCWSPNSILNPPVARRSMEDDAEELPKPARRRLAHGVCKDTDNGGILPVGTTETVLTNDEGENSICCVTPAGSDGAKLNPTQEWIDENNPGGKGYYKNGDPLTTLPVEYAIFEKCEVKDNTCVCTTAEEVVGQDGTTCPDSPPQPWGAGRRA